MSAAPHASRQVPAPKDRAKIISAIKKLVPERHINVSNPNQDYRPWIALVDERMPRLIDLDDAQAFESGVGELLRALGSSHTAFFHQRRDSVPAPYSINATLRAVDTPQGKRWMFVDVIEDGPTFHAGIRPGELVWMHFAGEIPVEFLQHCLVEVVARRQTEQREVIPRAAGLNLPARRAERRVTRALRRLGRPDRVGFDPFDR